MSMWRWVDYTKYGIIKAGTHGAILLVGIVGELLH